MGMRRGHCYHHHHCHQYRDEHHRWYLMLWCGCEIAVRCWKRCLCLGGPQRPISTPGPVSTILPQSTLCAIVFPHMGRQLCSSAPHGPTVPSAAATNSSTLCYTSPPPPVSHWVFGCGDSRHCPSPPVLRSLSSPCARVCFSLSPVPSSPLHAIPRSSSLSNQEDYPNLPVSRL